MRLILFIIIFSQSSFASLGEVIGDIYESNNTFKANRLDIQSSELNIEAVNAKYDWIFSTGITHRDSFRDSLLSFQSLRTINDTISASIQKSFSWGGTFAIEQGVTKYNLTKWGAASNLFTGGAFEERPYEYFSNIVFTQDLGRNFFGRNDKADIKLAQAEVALRKKQVESLEQQTIVQITTLYVRASYLKSLIQTSQENIKRYKRRVDLIRKRVRDGLRLDVDKLQAETMYLKQEEQLLSYQNDLAETTEQISILIESDVKLEKINAYSLKTRVTLKNWKSWEADSNLELEQAKVALLQVENALVKARRSRLPDVQLRASWGTNAIESNLGNAYDEGDISSRFQDKSISLNLTIPLGGRLAKVEVERSRVRQIQQQTRLEVLNKKMSLKFNSLKKRIETLNKRITSTKKRLSLTKRVRVNYDKLYEQGRVELDTLLNSEDEYNRGEVEHYTNLLNYELSLLDLAVLTDHVSEYVNGYKG